MATEQKGLCHSACNLRGRRRRGAPHTGGHKMVTLNWHHQVYRNVSFTIDQRNEYKYLTETFLTDVEYEKIVKQWSIIREKLSRVK